jgi:urease accessory protein
VERLVPLMIERGFSPGVVANDVVTQEDALIIRRGLAGILEPGRILGVETGTCPHQAVREDPSLNLAAVDQLAAGYPDIDLIFIESGGDNLTLTFSPLLARLSIYVMDVAGGDKTPRKQGPGMIQSDLLVINKSDLAPYVGADLSVMERDATTYRDGRPIIFTDSRHGDGLTEVAGWIAAAVAALPQAAAPAGARA